MLKRHSPSPTPAVQLRRRQVEYDLKVDLRVRLWDYPRSSTYRMQEKALTGCGRSDLASRNSEKRVRYWVTFFNVEKEFWICMNLLD